MKKNLLTLSVLAVSLTSNAQEVLTHVGTGATFYVVPNTLVYNGGGLQTQQTGTIQNYGNIMIDGTTSSVVRNVNASGTNTPTPNSIVLKISGTGAPATAPYGQLYIKGIPQSNITAIVDKEYAEVKHGTFQQIGIPFINKSFAELQTELGTTFGKRWSTTELVRWSNAYMRMEASTVPTSLITDPNGFYAIDPATSTIVDDKGGYFAMGTGGTLDMSALHTIKGVPYSETLVKTLSPSNITTYGVGGGDLNVYREKYNTYLSDPFHLTAPWYGNYAKNIHQFSNPYLTNIDLSLIGFDETAANPGNIGDGNAISNIYGILINPNNVQWSGGTGTTSAYANVQKVTFKTDGVPNGPFEALVIKPLGTFKIKLRDNATATLNFENLRRFASTPRSATTSYSVTAARNGSTVKQLGIIALNNTGDRLGSTYYNVANDYITGNASVVSNNSVQAFSEAASPIHTFEEEPTVGGIDQNYESAYRLYINEANEVDFKGKKVALGLFDSNVKSIRFEIAENAKYIANGAHELSSSIGFYYTKGNGPAVQIKNGDVLNVSGNDYAVYYGAPTSGVLASTEIKTPNRTLVVYNPDIENYIVRFDPSWKSADINVYDMSGKLVHTASKVKTATDYVIALDKAVKTGYVVKIKADNGAEVNTKILMK